VPTEILVNPLKRRGMLVEAMGLESASDMETKEFCGAARPSKVLKGKRGDS